MRVLIVRVGALGDVLHALPAVASLKALQPDATIDWIIDERWRPLVTCDDRPGPIVTRSYPVPTRAWKQSPISRATMADVLSFRKLRGQYDAVVDMQGTMRSAVLGWLAARGRTLAGYADPRESAAARLYANKLQRTGTHVVEQGAALLGAALGLHLEPRAFALPLDRNAELRIERDVVLGRPQALLAPGGGWGAKQWPAERYGEVAVALRERGYRVLVNAASEASPEARAVMDASQGAASIASGSIAELIALMRRTDLVIGGDTGPVHLAAALAVPTVALFGPTDPARNGPWGPGPKTVLRSSASPTTYKRSDLPDPGLQQVTVAEVLAAVDRIRRWAPSNATIT